MPAPKRCRQELPSSRAVRRDRLGLRHRRLQVEGAVRHWCRTGDSDALGGSDARVGENVRPHVVRSTRFCDVTDETLVANGIRMPDRGEFGGWISGGPIGGVGVGGARSNSSLSHRGHVGHKNYDVLAQGYL